MEDNFTKILQGEILRKLRVVIKGVQLNIPDIDLIWDISKGTTITITQECVGT